VDTRTEALIQHAMGELRRVGMSSVIAHRVSTIRDADLVLVMEVGRIVEQGTHAEFPARRGDYHQMTRVRGGRWMTGAEGADLRCACYAAATPKSKRWAAGPTHTAQACVPDVGKSAEKSDVEAGRPDIPAVVAGGAGAGHHGRQPLGSKLAALKRVARFGQEFDATEGAAAQCVFGAPRDHERSVYRVQLERTCTRSCRTRTSFFRLRLLA
jgi:hypothetical protein